MSVKIFGESLATVSLKNQKIKWDTPTIVGATVLDLAKYFMAKFLYETMKPNFDCDVCYSDTDSFILNVFCEDFYEELAAKPHVREFFDFSNFDKQHPLYTETNKKVVLKFKDEMAGELIQEFCGLKPKVRRCVSRIQF